MYLFYTLQITVACIVNLGGILVITPIYGIPGAMICALGYWIGRVFLRAQTPVKRETSNAKAPILTVVGSVLCGLGGQFLPIANLMAN
jgi:hypothetical protein